MSEDGLLVNFAPDEDVFNSKAIYKGGRWKDRLIARKVAGRRPKKPVVTNHDNSRQNAGADIEHESELVSRPHKRQKTSNSQTHKLRLPSESKGSKVVISSLFTSNPPPQKPAVEQIEGLLPAVPSNAPLLDGIDTFLSLGLSTTLATHLLRKVNLKAPTAIQKSAIAQLIKEDSDAFIQAETGSGKTLAYLLPIVQRIMGLSKPVDDNVQLEHIHRDSGLFAIILAPTRELSKQILSVLETLLRCASWIVAGIVIGGEKKKSEKARLRKGVNILVATPGRLADHLALTKVLDVSNVRWLVLDEGDRLMELGFEEEIRGIIAKLESESRPSKLPGLPSSRTTILCSATMKMNVQRLGDISLKDAVHILPEPVTKTSEVEAQQTTSKAFHAPNQLQQSYIVVPAKQRLVTLAALLTTTFGFTPTQRTKGIFKAIVFLTCADSVEFHFQLFSKSSLALNEVTASVNEKESKSTESSQGTSPPLSTVSTCPKISPNLRIYKLHGSLLQALRTSTLSSFHRSSIPSVLFCTDVASRGLDLPNVDLVIEYDPSFSADDHIHRVGRTARAGNAGKAVIFLMPGSEEGYVEVLQNAAGERIISNLSAEEVLKKAFLSRQRLGDSGKDGLAKVHNSWHDQATEFQFEIEREIAASERLQEMARKAYISHVRAYATHTLSERKWFDVKALHLGHLAKAFGLRERPGRFGRESQTSKAGNHRPKNAGEDQRKGRVKKGADPDCENVNVEGQASLNEGKSKMRRAMMEQMSAANEFNIG